MKPKQTLAEAQDQLFGSIRAFAEQLIANAYSRYNPDEGDFSVALALEKKTDPAGSKKRNDPYASKGIRALTGLGAVPGLELREACSIRYAKAEQNFLEAVRTYAETLVYDAYSRYDLDEKAFFTREAYEEIMKAFEDDEVIPMEDIAEELGIKW